MKKLSFFLVFILFYSLVIAADYRIQYTEKLVGAGHPTLADTLNRLSLIEHSSDGTHKDIHATSITISGGLYATSASFGSLSVGNILLSGLTSSTGSYNLLTSNTGSFGSLYASTASFLTIYPNIAAISSATITTASIISLSSTTITANFVSAPSTSIGAQISNSISTHTILGDLGTFYNLTTTNSASITTLSPTDLTVANQVTAPSGIFSTATGSTISANYLYGYFASLPTASVGNMSVNKATITDLTAYSFHSYMSATNISGATGTFTGGLFVNSGTSTTYPAMVSIQTSTDAGGYPLAAIYSYGTVTTDGPIGFYYFMNSYNSNTIGAISGSTNGTPDSGHIRIFAKATGQALTEAAKFDANFVTLPSLTNNGLGGAIFSNGSGKLQTNGYTQTTATGGGARQFTTVYHNTTGRLMHVVISLHNNTPGSSFAAITDSGSSPSQIVTNGNFYVANYVQSFTFLVLPDFYYKITTTGGSSFLDYWSETY